MTISDKKINVLLNDVIRPGVNLPSQVFYINFSKYFFFDNDICSSDYLIEATRSLILDALGWGGVAYIYSSSESVFLGELHVSDNWVERISALATEMNNSGDYGGLIIIGADKSWAIFQKTPVDEGVLGFSSNKVLSLRSELLYENFVDCETIKKWLREETAHSKDLVHNIGRDYLKNIIDNYC